MEALDALQPKDPMEGFKPYTKEDLGTPEAQLKFQDVLLDLQKKIMEYAAAIKNQVVQAATGEIPIETMIK
jgi:hypothetical protein